MYGGNIVLLIQKDANAKDVNPEDIEEIGVLAKVTLKLKLPSNNYRVKFKITNRVKVLEYTSVDPYFVVNYDKIYSILQNDDIERALIKNVEVEVSKNAQNLLTNPEEIARLISAGTNADVLTDVIAYQLRLNTYVSKYRYLAELNVSRRLEMILEDIEHEKQIVAIEEKINKDVKKSIDDSQKEYYLREKMRAIQNELGDKARQEEDVEKLRKALEEAKLPENVYKKVWMSFKSMLKHLIKWLNLELLEIT